MSSVENPSPSELFSRDSVFAAERVVTQKPRGCYRSRALDPLCLFLISPEYAVGRKKCTRAGYKRVRRHAARGVTEN